MTEDLVLLALDGDTCTGPAHLPAVSRRIVHNASGLRGQGSGNRSHRTQTLSERVRLGGGFPPLLWPSMCGEVAAGHLYARTELTVRGGECFTCRMAQLAAETPRKTGQPCGNRYETEEERREARRRTWREADRRKKLARGRAA